MVYRSLPGKCFNSTLGKDSSLPVFGPLTNPTLYYINRLLPLASFTIANHLLGSASVVDEMGRGVDQHGLLSNLCTLLVRLLQPTPRSRLPEVTPAGMASLLLGVSLAMMLGGLVTFVIGFILMPWALGTFAVFHLVEVVSHVSLLGKSLSSCRLSFPGIDLAP